MAAQINSEASLPHEVTPDEVRRTLERILKSRHFIHAPKKQRFLQLICDFYLTGRARELNEYLIGREVFDRDDSYNPGADPIVRVGAHDVRKRLELYYQNEGAQDEVRMGIPIGSYEPTFLRVAGVEGASEQPKADDALPTSGGLKTKSAFPLTAVEPSAPPVRSQGASRQTKLMWALGGVTIFLILITGTLLMRNRELTRQVSEIQAVSPGTYGPIWEPFLKSPDPTMLVVSNPPVYRFMNDGDPPSLIKRSILLPNDQAAFLTEALHGKFLIRNTPTPRLVLSQEDYTGLGEAIGLYRLTDLLRGAGRSVLLKQSRTVSPEDLKNHNLLFLGSVWTNEWSGKLPSDEDFVHSGHATIENRRPQPGEEREYESKFDAQSGDLTEDYALVTVKPNISNENTVMILAGIRSAGTEAAAEFITDARHLPKLAARLKQIGARGEMPRFYQVLLKVGVENGIPTTISPVAVHALSASKP